MSKKDYLRNYIGKELSIDAIRSIYRDHNVDHELSILYRDIVLTLNHLIFNTFLGDDVMSVDDYDGHFHWCWEETKRIFNTEGFEIDDNEELKTYFNLFYTDIFYSLEDKSDVAYISVNIKKLWSYMFNVTNVKSKSDVDVFIELYTLFSESIFENNLDF